MGEQLSFEDVVRHGGRRKGAGRKVRGRASVRHRQRPAHKWWNPIHVTMRARRGLASFRSQVVAALFEKVIREAQREEFRIVEFSIQGDHVHMLVEAQDQPALTRNMRSVMVRLALRLNRLFGRSRGRVWAERYHRTDLTSPRQVRNAIVYVVQNYKKHFGVRDGRPFIDPFSSARWFEGWTAIRAHPAGPRPTALARTRLLSDLWKRHGLIHPGEHPRSLK